MRDSADLVIIGAGIVGCATAHVLAAKGWRDVVIVDQGPLFETGGSTSHAPGLIFELNSSRTMCRLAQRSVDLFSSVFLDGQPCYFPTGSLEVATTPQRWEDLKRKLGLAMSWGLSAALIPPEVAGRMVPLLDSSKILGALHVSTDGVAKAVRTAEALAATAYQAGFEFHGRTTVTGIEVERGRVVAVQTDRGRVRTPRVLVCAGIWGPRVGRLAGVPLPLTPCEHQYAITAPLPALSGETREAGHAIVRHQDASMYFRPVNDRYGIGSYRHAPRLVSPDEIAAPNDALMPSLRPFTLKDFTSAQATAEELFPPLRGVALTHQINGLFSFTPDGNPLLGESADVRGFWAAEAVWVTHAGGVGRAVAELLSGETPDLDLRELDLNRFPPHAVTGEYVRLRGAAQYREVYDIIHPLQQVEAPRRLRQSPFHSRQQALDAVFFESAGWERPHWFEGNAALPVEPSWPRREGWSAKNWSPRIGAEHVACRTNGGLFDLTPFSKLEIAGPGALAFLEHMATRRIAGPVGTVKYTCLCNEVGGVISDLTVTRLAAERFLVVTGALAGPRDRAWLRRHQPDDGSVTITDVTSAWCAVGVWGPNAPQLLQLVAGIDPSIASFPMFTARPLELGCIPSLALRLSYVGEAGWEVYAPTEYGPALWDMLWHAGQELGIAAVGMGALDSLRLEKGYRLGGVDLTTEHTPFESGLGFTVDLDKGNFLGRTALMRAKVEGPRRKLCCLIFDDPAAVALGKEPVLVKGVPVGFVTSANYGYTVGKSLAYAWLPIAHSSIGTRVEVRYFDKPFAAIVVREPLFDPAGSRLRCQEPDFPLR